MPDLVRIDNGSTFKGPIRFVGFIVILLSVLLAASCMLCALIPLVFGLIVVLARNVTEINLHRRQVRESSSILNWSFGTWKDLNKFHSITVLSRKFAYRILSRGQRATSEESQYYDICLLTENHLKKLVLQRTSNKEQALQRIKELAELLDVELVRFQPKVSKRRRPRP